ncbi:DUF1638 domain-containing protein [Desulfotruncus alcoholivorax]|uniref:DUF1638 domain-containing protein n=1 Tax=Desulfotruncus alcoholivorax TaxID=265477 RepID=UPI001EE5F581|nr:DUF1638 domain-containing protein [Desulfotruncus alcoholivorax]
MNKKNADITYVDAALHVDLDKLSQSVTENLREIAGNNISLIIGNQCHPEME